MRKIALFFAVCLFSSTVFAAPLRSGLYVNAKAGAMRTNITTPSEKGDDVPFMMALALGGRIRHFRIEAEYKFGTKAKMKDYEQQMEAVTCQLYFDIPFKSPIRPFVNGGLGRHETKITQGKDEETRKGSVWNLGGGVTWNVSNAVNIDIGYRYIDTGDFKTRHGTVETKNHFVYLGWRYVF